MPIQQGSWYPSLVQGNVWKSLNELLGVKADVEIDVDQFNVSNGKATVHLVLSISFPLVAADKDLIE